MLHPHYRWQFWWLQVMPGISLAVMLICLLALPLLFPVPLLCQALLADRSRVLQVVLDEAKAVAAKHGQPRRSRILVRMQADVIHAHLGTVTLQPPAYSWLVATLYIQPPCYMCHAEFVHKQPPGAYRVVVSVGFRASASFLCRSIGMVFSTVRSPTAVCCPCRLSQQRRGLS